MFLYGGSDCGGWGGILEIRLASFVGQPVRAVTKLGMRSWQADLLNKITTENNTSDDPAELAREQLIAS